MFTSSRACVDVRITDDTYVERDTGFFRERFQVALSRGDEDKPKAMIDPDRDTTVVFIVDDDSKCLHSNSLPHACSIPSLFPVFLSLLLSRKC